jgi:hypothetical protein
MVALKEKRICDLHFGDLVNTFVPLRIGESRDTRIALFLLGKIATKISTRLCGRSMIAIRQAIIGLLNTPAKSSGPWKFSSGCR